MINKKKFYFKIFLIFAPLVILSVYLNYDQPLLAKGKNIRVWVTPSPTVNPSINRCDCKCESDYMEEDSQANIQENLRRVL